jgi:hypothetical protein
MSDHQPGPWQDTGVIAPSDLNAVVTTATQTILIGRHPDGRIWRHPFTFAP